MTKARDLINRQLNELPRQGLDFPDEFRLGRYNFERDHWDGPNGELYHIIPKPIPHQSLLCTMASSIAVKLAWLCTYTMQHGWVTLDTPDNTYTTSLQHFYHLYM